MHSNKILDCAVLDEKTIAAIGDLRRTRQCHFLTGAASSTPAEDAGAVGAAEAAEGGRTRGPLCPQAISANAIQHVPSANEARRLTPTLADRVTMHSILSTMTSKLSPQPLSESDYASKTSAVLAGIEATLDRWLDEDVIDVDTHRTGGLLELIFPDRSKIVLNTQPPLQELWLAARAGGFHFRWAGDCWRDTREQREFFEALSTLASEQAGRPLRFEST